MSNRMDEADIAENRRLLVGAEVYTQPEVDAMTDDEVRTAAFAAFFLDESGYA